MNIKVLIILFVYLPFMFADWLPKIIWTYWEEPITPQSYQQFYHHNRLRYAPDWDVRILNKYTYRQYLNKIPQFKGFSQQFNKIGISHRANYIRINLLAYYGGVWIDYSTFMTENFNWMTLQQLQHNPDVHNKYHEQPEVFLFALNAYSTKKQFYDQKTDKNFTLSPGYQIWFLSAKPNSKFFRDLVNIAQEALLNDGYGHSPDKNDYLENKTRSNNVTIRAFNHYLLFNSLIQILIQTKQQQLDAQLSPNRQLAVWYYNIWHINAMDGPMSYFKFDKQQPQQKLNFLIGYAEDTVHGFGISTKYFIKLVGPDRDELRQYFTFPSNFFHAIYLQITHWRHDYFIKYFCPASLKIRKDSVVGNYLIGQNKNRYGFVFNYPEGSQTPCIFFKVIEIVILITAIVAIILLPIVLYFGPKIIQKYALSIRDKVDIQEQALTHQNKFQQLQ